MIRSSRWLSTTVRWLSRPAIQPLKLVSRPASHMSPARRQDTTHGNGNSNGNSNESADDDDDDSPSPKRTYDRRYTTKQDIARSGRDRPPQDHEISDPQIMVIDQGAVEGPLATRYVLTKLDPGESLRMISPFVPGDPPAGIPDTLAVCKIINKRDEYERQRSLKERRVAKPKSKTLELTWAIGANDLQVKLARLAAFLERGCKVDLTIGRKKGGRGVTADEAADVLRRLREGMEEHGGRESKPAAGKMGGTMTLYLERKK